MKGGKNLEDHNIVDLYWFRDENAISETDKKYGSYCNTIANNILYNLEDSKECPATPLSVNRWWPWSMTSPGAICGRVFPGITPICQLKISLSAK